jgi:hypothetical protein
MMTLMMSFSSKQCSEDRQAFIHWIDRVSKKVIPCRFHLMKVVISSRAEGFEKLPPKFNEKFIMYRMEPLSEVQRKKFLRYMIEFADDVPVTQRTEREARTEALAKHLGIPSTPLMLLLLLCVIVNSNKVIIPLP